MILTGGWSRSTSEVGGIESGMRSDENAIFEGRMSESRRSFEYSEGHAPSPGLPLGGEPAMRRKVRVSFDVEPKLEFTTTETYPGLGITPEYEDANLTGLRVDVEIEANDDDEITKSFARQKITALLERLRYITGWHLAVEAVRIEQIDPPCEKAVGLTSFTVGVCITDKCQMPIEEDLLDNQDENTTYQLMYYNRATKADDLAEKIRNFYMVIEREAEIDITYKESISERLKYTRNAVSHPTLNRMNAKNFLKDNIGSCSVDYGNPDHMRFLRAMLPEFKDEAERILNRKVPKSREINS